MRDGPYFWENLWDSHLGRVCHLPFISSKPMKGSIEWLFWVVGSPNITMGLMLKMWPNSFIICPERYNLSMDRLWWYCKFLCLARWDSEKQCSDLTKRPPRRSAPPCFPLQMFRLSTIWVINYVQMCHQIVHHLRMLMCYFIIESQW